MSLLQYRKFERKDHTRNIILQYRYKCYHWKASTAKCQHNQFNYSTCAYRSMQHQNNSDFVVVLAFDDTALQLNPFVP